MDRSALLARFAAIVGDKYAITDPEIQAPYLIEMRDMFQGRTPVVLRPATVAEVSADRQARQRRPNADRAARRQYRPGRRSNPAAQRDRAVAEPARPHPRDRSDLEYHHLRSRRRPCSTPAKPPPQWTGFIRNCCRRKAPAPSAAISPPMPAARRAIAHGVARSHVLGIEVVLADGRVCTISTS